MVHLEKIEEVLTSKGFPPDVRRAIKNSKIGIIDDRLEDLESFVDGLKSEGYTNLVEKTKVDSVDEIHNQEFDLVILDLAGVANDKFKDDGIGLLTQLKRVEPWLPVLVVTGSTLEPEFAKPLSQADLIRSKPVLPSDLASDVEELLRFKKDSLWAALDTLRELRKLSSDVSEKLSWMQRIKLFYYRYCIEKDLQNSRRSVSDRIVKVASTISPLGTAALRIQQLAKGFSD